MKTLYAIAYLVLAGAPSSGQDTVPAFEVASVKAAAPQDRGRRSVRMTMNASRVDFANVSLDDVLTRAYGVKRFQIQGPNWLFSERYDIVATIPEGTEPDLVPLMFRQLLKERFGMAVRVDSRDEKVYALVVSKGGPKLKAAENPEENARGPKSEAHAGKDAEGKTGGMERGPNGTARLQAKAVTLEQFADNLSKLMDRPVTNQTGLEGTYDFTLDISAEDMQHARDGGKNDGRDSGTTRDLVPASVPSPTIFAAVQQYGLRLEPRKAPLKYLVVEKADKVPSRN